MHRAAVPTINQRWTKAAAGVAGVVGRTMRGVPGYAGAAALVVGAGMIYQPLAWLVGGAFLMLVDWRMP